MSHFNEEVRGASPVLAPADWTGFDLLHSYVRGQTEPPPVSRLTGLRPTEVGVGRSAFALPVSPWLQTGFGFIDPGVMAFLADAPLSTAIATGLPPGKAVLTSELTLTILQPINRDASGLVGRARTLHANRQVGVSLCEITDSDGRLLAHGSTRCVVLDATTTPAGTSTAAPVAYDTPDPWQRPFVRHIEEPAFWADRSGLEMVRAVAAGEIDPAPSADLIGFRLPTQVDEGAVTIALPTSRWLCSPGPALFGGVVAWFAQASMELAMLTTMPAGTLYGTLDLRVHFLRPIMPDSGDLTATATVDHRGRLVTVATTKLTTGEGKTAAIARASAMVVPDGLRRMLKGDFRTDAMAAGGEMVAAAVRE